MSAFTNTTVRQKLPAYRYIRETDHMPAIYANDGVPDPLVRVKLFDPTGSWTWYLTEFDGDQEAYGLVVGHETEYGYIDLAELAAFRGRFSLPIERDIHFTPIPLSQVRERIDRANGVGVSGYGVDVHEEPVS